MTFRATLTALLLAAPGLGLAQDGPRLAFTLGAGIETLPDYLGSDESTLGPAFSVTDGYLSFGGLSLGDADPTDLETGFGFKGSFAYVPGRSAADDPRLAGTDDIAPAFEFGGGIDYAGTWWDAFAVARVGFGGHHAVVGEVGMNLVARPTDRLEVRAGPRVVIGSGDYASTYFGVTDAEAAAGPLPSFDADGGVLSSGVELGATYDLTDTWGLSATARYDRLQGDAADSPISSSDDQMSATLEITRRFDFRF